MQKHSSIKDEHRKVFGLVLKEMRTDRRMSQVEVAKKLNRPQSYIGKIESGERRVSYLEARAIAEACNQSTVIFDNSFDRALEKLEPAKKRQ